MVKVQAIHEKLWGALNYITSEVGFAVEITRSKSTPLAKANNLVREYASCFGSDGKVSQRGEVPQCWNRETIFTPHREVGVVETPIEQPLLPFKESISCEKEESNA